MITEDSLQLHGLFYKVVPAWWPAFALEENINSICYYEEDILTLQTFNTRLKIPENYRQSNFAPICSTYTRLKLFVSWFGRNSVYMKGHKKWQIYTMPVIYVYSHCS